MKTDCNGKTDLTAVLSNTAASGVTMGPLDAIKGVNLVKQSLKCSTETARDWGTILPEEECKQAKTFLLSDYV